MIPSPLPLLPAVLGVMLGLAFVWFLLWIFTPPTE